ncbi:Mth938-like domain-containing protein [Fibrobacterota bacterium]
MITDYTFGHMVIDGKEFNKDVIIFPDGRVLSPWWRKEGHSLKRNDLRELIDAGPRVIVAGTGAYGVMKPSDKVQELLREKGIEFIAAPSKEAVEIYNELCAKKKTGGCFHLTC